MARVTFQAFKIKEQFFIFLNVTDWFKSNQDECLKCVNNSNELFVVVL